MSIPVPQIRRPEYTGENRCIPCTIVNIGIASIGSLVIAVRAPLLAAVIFSLSLVLIYLRGYLVPGTPSFTKKYLPRSILRWFGKERTYVSKSHEVSVEPEQILIQCDAVALCESGQDLCLNPDFRTSWREHMHTPITDHCTESLHDAISTDKEHVSFVEHGDALVARNGEGIIGQWPSPVAIEADVAAAAELTRRYSEWDRLNCTEKARLLLSLRVFLEECPDCGGTVHLGQEVVDSCCQSYDVVVSACQKCDAKLFEMEWQDEFAHTERADGTERPATV